MPSVTPSCRLRARPYKRAGLRNPVSLILHRERGDKVFGERLGSTAQALLRPASSTPSTCLTTLPSRLLLLPADPLLLRHWSLPSTNSYVFFVLLLFPMMITSIAVCVDV